MKTVKSSFGDDCQNCRDLERILMPQDTRECIEKLLGHYSRQLTDPLSQSLHLFNVQR